MFAGFRNVCDISDVMGIREVKVVSGDLQGKILAYRKLKQRDAFKT